MQNVLIIRPLKEAQNLANLLKTINVKTSLYPLFKPLYLPVPSFEKPQALIITSKQALKAIEQREDLKSVPLYVVGAHTASHAKKIGFSKILLSALTSWELIRFIEVTAKPEKGPLVYLSGEKIDGGIQNKLSQSGFTVIRHIVYKIEDATDLPADLINEMQSKSLSHVLFFSPRTTSVFVQLLKARGLNKNLSHMTSLCLSLNVALQARELNWKEVWISPLPTTTSLLGYFDE